MHKNRLGKTNLNVSFAGYGSYRVSNRIQEHHESLEYALLNGINLIDTSSNYADGESEILIGNVIEKLSSDNKIKREEITIVSKGGYIQGKNLQFVNEKKIEGIPYKEIVVCSPDLQHSIDPDFLSDQIDLSLERLKTDYIDVYLLHNPEYFLTYSKMNSLTELRNEYYTRIEKAFRLLETKVEEGKIKWYGISSNTFGANSDKLNFTSLEKVVEIAESISKTNKFAVVQFPLNAIERSNASTKNQNNNSISFLELANKKDLGVLVNRPLNGIVDNQLIRLADFEIKENISKEETFELADEISKLEDDLLNITESIADESIRNNVTDCLSLGKILKDNFDKFNSVSHFKDLRNQYFIPRADYAIKNLFESNQDNKSIISRLNNFAVHLNILLDSFESVFALEANENNLELHYEMNNYLDHQFHSLRLSQKSVLVTALLEEISCSLVGMRKTDYVKDILEIPDFQKNDKIRMYWGLN